MNTRTFLFLVVFLIVAQSAFCAPKDKKHKSKGKYKTWVDQNQVELEGAKNRVIKYIQKNDPDTTRAINELLEPVKDKCPQVDKVPKLLDDVYGCVKNTTVGSGTVCSTIQKTIEKCYGPLIDLVGSCLPKESNELPLLAQKIIIGGLKQVCTFTVEEFLELFAPCQSETNWADVSSCNDVRAAVEEFEKKLPSTQIICSLLPKLKTCANDVHSSSCKNPITLRSFTRVEESVLKESEPVCRGKN
ncbi:uncharacterized protein LOC114339677 [Diabrotica virgifera virgifera]|uniref:Uncharacterized protein LOC114339677 n=1 Tax=Diabrotica virgifera virgifera TaxID=50390 RepID=A0A6P7GQU6_DIAVI|nr:uncharacterized protein LOC114339677 [Diabrotica virgifera virgifera]